MDETQTLALLAFFDGRPEEAALARALLRGILSALPETQVQVQKTQITLKHRHVFAALSLPRRSRDRKDHKLTLTLGLAHRLDSPRVAVATEPYPRRWTHHVLLTRLDDLDELFACRLVAELGDRRGCLGCGHASSLPITADDGIDRAVRERQQQGIAGRDIRRRTHNRPAGALHDRVAAFERGQGAEGAHLTAQVVDLVGRTVEAGADQGAGQRDPGADLVGTAGEDRGGVLEHGA